MIPKEKNLKNLMNRGEMVVAIGAHDALNAQLVEKIGFNAIYIGSYSLEGTQKGEPDMDIMTKTEKLTVIRNIVNAVNIPVIADMEEGYGDVVNVIKAVNEFESTGVSGVHLDDQKIPSKCPFIPNLPKTELISVKEMCAKIKAATDSRSDPDFMIIVRSDVIGTVAREKYYSDNMIEEVVERSNAYTEAGADAIFVMALTIEEVNYFAKNIHAPLVGIFAYMEPIAIKEFKKAGYKMAIGANLCMWMAAKGVMNGLKVLKQTQDFNAIRKFLITDEEFYDIIDINKYEKYYKKYS
ncbi:MAG: isocitrate lyase/PEP mutase family protein [Actinobacteria bacterium]|nr:isocitrate lyase/PEP mutase family protein [Actinomycetota bacterium]